MTRLALRLAGLQVLRRQRDGSPGRRVQRRLRGKNLRAFFQLRHHQLMASIKELQVGQIPGDNR
ncbi:hypothetical protein FNL49_00750 [Klebsiella michiganensis]|nr:hypothetical protein AM394_24830 [Klebsiella oxytoca]MBW5935413.1 hypothetical protein [Klebsiella michiganensis]AUW14525.1 hypothetical protein C2U42_30090 [Klebsiella oxytoca]MBX4822078.1 hypothetical protein [Klebsiella michiganensis]OLP14499.1 hypothetical protein AGG97_12540 [Klebsiella michiganensis]